MEQNQTSPITETPTTEAPTAGHASPETSVTQDNSIDIEHFAKVELRVAEVVSAEAVPKSKKLLKLQVNLGEKLGQRQILSGISQFYAPESLVGKRIIVVANLKPATLMGLESRGMLLAGSTEDNSVLAIIEPAPSLPLGTLIR